MFKISSIYSLAKNSIFLGESFPLLFTSGRRCEHFAVTEECTCLVAVHIFVNVLTKKQILP